MPLIFLSFSFQQRQSFRPLLHLREGNHQVFSGLHQTFTRAVTAKGEPPNFIFPPLSSNASLDTCSADLFDESSPTNCSNFVYDSSEFSETLSTRLDLVCARVGMRHFLGSVMMVGLTLGSFLGGPLGDRFGRKKAMFCGMIVVIPSVILGGFVDSYVVWNLTTL